MWVLLVCGIIASIGILLSIGSGYVGYMPEMQQLSNPVDKFASQVISADGKLVGTYSYGATNRIFTEYDSISPDLINALIATEDERFYEHSGIDVKALMRAIR